MDKEELKKNIAKFYIRLPEKSQKFFSDMAWMKILENISIKYRLDNKKIEVLGTETSLVLLAIIKTEDYREILEKELELPSDIFNQLFSEIQNSILNDHYKELDETFRKNVDILVDEKYNTGGKKLDERFNVLPKEIKDIIENSDFQSTLYTIAEKHELTIEQMGTLEEITIKVMLGIIHPEKYEEELSKSIKIQSEDLSDLINGVNDNILKKIRDSLKKHWDDTEKIEKDIAPIPSYKQETIIKKDEEDKEEIPIPPYNKINTEEQTKEEQKTPINPINIMEDKLKEISHNDHGTTDYSVPKINDPYRESI